MSKVLYFNTSSSILLVLILCLVVSLGGEQLLLDLVLGLQHEERVQARDHHTQHPAGEEKQ